MNANLIACIVSGVAYPDLTSTDYPCFGRVMYNNAVWLYGLHSVNDFPQFVRWVGDVSPSSKEDIFIDCIDCKLEYLRGGMYIDSNMAGVK